MVEIFVVIIKNQITNYTDCIIRITKWAHKLLKCYIITDMIQNIKTAYFLPVL